MNKTAGVKFSVIRVSSQIAFVYTRNLSTNHLISLKVPEKVIYMLGAFFPMFAHEKATKS